MHLGEVYFALSFCQRPQGARTHLRFSNPANNGVMTLLGITGGRSTISGNLAANEPMILLLLFVCPQEMFRSSCWKDVMSQVTLL